MKPGFDLIYVDKADINEGQSAGKITKAALYFTREYLYVLPCESLRILQAGIESNYNSKSDCIEVINKQIPDLDKDGFHKLMQTMIGSEWIYRIADLKQFSIHTGFWIFGGIQIRKKDSELQVFNIQPKTLREKIRNFYNQK
jgi:hypothetical protein